MNEEKILEKLIKLDEYVREKLVTQESLNKRLGATDKLLEHVAVTVNRLDSDRLVSRHELDRHDKDIKVLKKHLNLF